MFHILAVIEFYKSNLVDLFISWVPDQIDFVCFFLIADKDSLPCSFGKLCSLFFWDQHPGRAAKYPQLPRFRLLVPPKLPWALTHILVNSPIPQIGCRSIGNLPVSCLDVHLVPHSSPSFAYSPH